VAYRRDREMARCRVIENARSHARRPQFVFAPERPAGGAVQAMGAGMLLLALMPAASWAPSAADPPLDAREIMRRNFMVGKVVDSVSDARFTLVNKLGQRRERRTTFSTTKLQANGVDNRRMVEFLAPPDVKGTAILLVERSDADDDIWIYLPALKKVRRLVASNKKDSFAGTDFSYGDVIGHKVDEWHHTLRGEETLDGVACFVIESTPRSEAVGSATGYAAA